MRIRIYYFIALALWTSLACAKEHETWNWYYAAFYAPSPESKLLVRSGTAQVSIASNKIHIAFNERDSPDVRASFNGEMTRTGAVKGTLNGFFMHGAESRSGSYREMGSIRNCHWQEIVLRPSVPDGSVLTIARTEGKCQ